jgi:hypothetical protein
MKNWKRLENIRITFMTSPCLFMIIDEDFFNLSVPVEATAFLAAVSAFAVFLLVIFVYVNKKWRLLNVGVPAAKSSTLVRRISPSLKLGHDEVPLKGGIQQFRSPMGELSMVSFPIQYLTQIYNRTQGHKV